MNAEQAKNLRSVVSRLGAPNDQIHEGLKRFAAMSAEVGSDWTAEIREAVSSPAADWSPRSESIMKALAIYGVQKFIIGDANNALESADIDAGL